jgi:hypothetical protein
MISANEQQFSTETKGNFNLKNVVVDLFATGTTAAPVHVSLDALEAMRVNRRIIPASKYGLETICGASCETGAQ